MRVLGGIGGWSGGGPRRHRSERSAKRVGRVTGAAPSSRRAPPGRTAAAPARGSAPARGWAAWKGQVLFAFPPHTQPLWLLWGAFFEVDRRGGSSSSTTSQTLLCCGWDSQNRSTKKLPNRVIIKYLYIVFCMLLCILVAPPQSIFDACLSHAIGSLPAGQKKAPSQLLFLEPASWNDEGGKTKFQREWFVHFLLLLMLLLFY